MKPSSDKEAMTLILEGMVQAGCILLNVDNGEEVVKVETVEKAVEEVSSVDEATVVLRLPGDDKRQGWVYFVLGNDPEEVACNWTVNLSEFIDPIVNPWWNL